MKKSGLAYINVVEKYKTWRHIATRIVYLGIAYFVYLSVKELAGKKTIAAFFIEHISKIGNTLPWLLAISFFIWAVIEHRLRLKKVKEFSRRIKELETHIDPNRTSSGIMETGETHPGDTHG